MKKLNVIHFSAAKELTKSEQKELKGGLIGSVACRCWCEGSVGSWLSYTLSGTCPSSKLISHEDTKNCTSNVAICEQFNG